MTTAKSTYDLGDLAEVRLDLHDLAGDPTDADNVTIRVRDPDGVEQLHELGVDGFITHAAVGVYTARISLTVPGRWRYRWETFEPQAAEESWLSVLRGSFAEPEDPGELGPAMPNHVTVRDPTSASYSELLSAAFPDDPGDNLALDKWLAVGGRLVASLTCRLIGDAAGESMEAVPDDLLPLAERVVVWRTEVLVQRGSTSAARSKAIRSGNLSSISAGPWSESYFGPEKAMQAKQLDPDPDLAALLWSLATPECREGWLALWDGTVAPAATAIAFEYENRPGGYGYGGGQEYL